MTENANKGEVSRLPGAVREQVCQRIFDGATDEAVAAWLTASGHDLGPGSVRTWRAGTPDQKSRPGYVRWCADCQRRADMQRTRDLALQIVREGGAEIHEAASQIAASQLYELLDEFDLDRVKARLSDDPKLYTDLIRALASLTKGGVEFARFRAHVNEQKNRIEEVVKKGTGGITPEAHEAIIRELNLL